MTEGQAVRYVQRMYACFLIGLGRRLSTFWDEDRCVRQFRVNLREAAENENGHFSPENFRKAYDLPGMCADDIAYVIGIAEGHPVATDRPVGLYADWVIVYQREGTGFNDWVEEMVPKLVECWDYVDDADAARGILEEVRTHRSEVVQGKNPLIDHLP